MRANSPAVMTILVINVVMFLLQSVPGVTEALFMFPAAIAAGEWYRLLTAVVLHGGLIHIAMNSYVLYVFGPNVEQTFGTVRFVLMYVIAGFVASALSFAVPPDNASLGASGAIFGLAGILLVYLYRRRRSAFVAQYLRNITFFIVANIVFGFLFPGIDNLAHLGGLIAGILLGLGFDRARAAVAPLAQLLTAGGVLAIGVLLVLLRTTGLIF